MPLGCPASWVRGLRGLGVEQPTFGSEVLILARRTIHQEGEFDKIQYQAESITPPAQALDPAGAPVPAETPGRAHP